MKKEKMAVKTKKLKKNGENGKKNAFGRWTSCAIKVYLRNVPFAKSSASLAFWGRRRASFEVEFALATATGDCWRDGEFANRNRREREKAGKRDAATVGERREKNKRLPAIGVGRVLEDAAPSSLFWSRFDASGVFGTR